MDDVQMRVAVEVAIGEALELADSLAEKIAAGTPSIARSTQELALAYQGKRRDIRRLRQELRAEVAG